jgi:hypothetical protein
MGLGTTNAAEAAASAASKAMYGGAATVTASGLLSADSFTAVVGIVLGGLGFVVNLYYRNREDKRRQKLLDAKLALVARGKLDTGTDYSELDG